jgi:hypothetical protein
MSKAAQPVAIKAVPTSGSMTDVADVLPLPSNGAPVAVAVSYDSGNDKVVFSLGTQSGYSLSWKAGGYALVINFIFDDQIKELSPVTPSSWFSSTFLDDAGKNRQTCCVPPVPGEYHIAADVIPDLATGTVTHLVDPIIVVTPIVTS